MNQKQTVLATLVLGLSSICALQAVEPEHHGAPEIVPHRMNARVDSQPTKGSTSRVTPSIQFHGGPVIGTPTVYVIWYGDWTGNLGNGSDTPAGQEVVRAFLRSIGGSEYFNINTSYYSGSTRVSGKVAFQAETSVGSPYSKSLSDGDITTIVQTARSTVPNFGLNDPNAIYFVLTSSDVNETSGFCTQYCGWHTSLGSVRYSFVGNANRCLNGCAAQLKSPNNNAGVDGMLSVIAHELEEATTDPDLNAWFDARGAEDADKCAWTFGQSQTYNATTGAWSNMTLTDPHTGLQHDYLIQRELYHSGNGDYCATALKSNGSITH